MSITPSSRPTTVGRFSSTSGRPFAATSAFNAPIPANPVLDPQNAGMVNQLQTGSHVTDITEFGLPIYHADASTPKRAVPCTRSAEWGPCPTNQPVPVPVGVKPSPGSDGAMVIIDWSTRIVYEYWKYTGTSTAWSQSNPIDGDGRQGGAVGAGVSRLAGIIRTYEIEQGNIPHALVFSTNMACPTVFRYPATKTDGWNNAGIQPCIPEGARIQLDPSINIDTQPGLSRGERTIAKALQRYGAYTIDNGGARLAFIMQTPTADTTNPYPANGLTEYGNLNLPWDRLRVLRNWDGK